MFAVSNKCTHLGLPLVGKTALLQGKVRVPVWVLCTSALCFSNASPIPPYMVHALRVFHNKPPACLEQVVDSCIVCPAHNTAFDLKTGAVKGEWCPKFPTLPLVGKGTPSKPLPTYPVRLGPAGEVEVNV